MIKAVINIEATREHVFAILTDFPRYKEWIPGCEQSNVLSQSGSSTDASIVVNSMKRIELGLRFEAQPVQALNFRMVKGKDIKAYSGVYRLMDAADGKGTLVIAELEIDAGFMVPKFMVDRMTQKMLDDTGAAMRKYIQNTPPSTAVAARGPKKAAVDAKPRRAKRILRVVKSPDGYRLWILGETFQVKSQGV